MKNYVFKAILALLLITLLSGWPITIGQAYAQGATAQLFFDNTANQLFVTIQSPTGVTRAQVVVDIPTEITVTNVQLSGFMKDAIPLSNGTERRWIQLSGNGETEGSVTITIASPRGITSIIKLVSVGLKDAQENAIPVTVLSASVQVPPTGAPPTGTMTWPFYLLVALLVVAVGVILFLVIRKPVSRKAMPQATTDQTRSEAASVSTSKVAAPVAKAILIFPNGSSIPFTGSSKIVGRSDFQSVLPIDKLVSISRRHLSITLEIGKYYAEDKNSANGTLLNSVEIKGKGRFELKDGDVIEPANEAKFTFRIL
jgi:hypothetical protein